MDLLESKNIKYSIVREDAEKNDYITVSSKADKMQSMTLSFFIDDNDICVKVFGVANVPEEKKPTVLNALNELHKKYRWVTFFIDEEEEVVAQIDSKFKSNESAPELFWELLLRAYDIVNDSYPEIMKSIW